MNHRIPGLVICFLTISIALHAQFTGPEINYHYSPGKKESLDYQSIQFHQVGLDLAYPIKLNPNNTLAPFLRMHQVAMNSPVYGNLDFTSIRLQLNWFNKINEKWTARYSLIPGLSTDFNAFNSEQFQLGVAAIFQRKYTEHFSVDFGAFYNGEYFGPFLTPVLGFNWNISEKSQIKALLPQYMTYRYSVTGSLGFGLKYFSDIRSYRIGLNEQKNYMEKWINYLALFGEYYLGDKLVLQAQFGYNLAREIAIYDRGEQLDLRILTFKMGDERLALEMDDKAAYFFQLGIIYRVLD